MQDSTWQTLDWHKVRTTEDLLTIRAEQIARLGNMRDKSLEDLRAGRQRAIDDANARTRFLDFSDFKPGMWVLLLDSKERQQLGDNGAPRWLGPFIIHECVGNKAFKIRQLDGLVLPNSVTAHRLKLFYYRDDQQMITSTV
ncbi:hypothetical protein EV122DRAFT_226742 [Schizophyllum commune]